MGTLVVRAWRRVWSSPLLTLNGWVAFNLPRVVTGSGVALLLVIVAVHAYVVATQALPTYFIVYAALLAAACVVAAAVTARGRSAGWYLGSGVCLVFLGIYLGSRVVGLTALAGLTGRWDVAPGTLAMACAAGFVGVHATVLSGLNVAYPNRQGWHD